MKTSSRSLRRLALPALLFLAACGGPDWSELPPIAPATVQPPPASAAAATAETLAAFSRVGEERAASSYRLGPGDIIYVDVYGRSELSGRQTIGPDGTITLPVVGDLMIGGLERPAALAAIEASLAAAYRDLIVTLRVEEYRSLRVTVLGQVRSPGEQSFDRSPDLLRAIGAAGGMVEPADGLTPERSAEAAAAETRQWRAAIFRGREAVLWLDLDALFRDGDTSLNVPLVAGDVVHVRAESLPTVSVLGEVTKPGMYPLRAGGTVMEALAMAGGTTEDASDSGVRLLRPRRGQASGFDYQAYTLGEFQRDLPLAAGDVIYVPSSTIADIGYFFRQFSPVVQLLVVDQVRD